MAAAHTHTLVQGQEASTGDALTQAVGDFSGRLTAEIVGVSKENSYVFSPLSVHLALGMVLQGTRGQTQEKWFQTLGFERGAEQNQEYLALISKLLRLCSSDYEAESEAAQGESESIEQQELKKHCSIANKVYVEEDADIVPSFASVCRESFLTEPGLANFREHPEEARTEINAWIEKKTSIAGVLPPKSVDSSVRMILVNAVHFKSTWVHRFEKQNTHPALFHRLNKGSSSPLSVNMMNQFNVKARGWSGHSVGGAEFSSLELPYTGNNFSMVFLLPDEGSTLHALEATLAQQGHEPFLSSVRSAHKQQVYSKIGVPRFRLDSPAIELLPILGKMGLPTQGDFSGLLAGEQIELQKVIHKAFMEVDEEGTEAAAVTAVFMGLMAAAVPEPPKPKFVLDRPFLCLLALTHQPLALFSARIVAPEQSSHH